MTETRRTGPIGLLLLAGLLGPACSAGPGVAPADLVVRGGRIVTVDENQPEAEALAARSGTIVAIGSEADVEPYIGPDTRLIELPAGALAVPGLIEGHGHYMSYGASLSELELRFAESWAEIVSLVADAVAEVEPGDWIVGRGWHQDKWTTPPRPSVEGLPTHATLSAVSPDNPVLLRRTSGHGVFVNVSAMAAAGLSGDTADPPGGEAVRGPDGHLIGMLLETAALPAEQALADYRARRSPEEIDAERRLQVQLAAEASIRHGITSFQDMGSTFDTIDLLRTMADEGPLPIRLYMAIEETAANMEGRLADYRIVGAGGGSLTVRTIGEKVFDGALGTHGGWLLEPYADLPRSSGFNVTPIDDIVRSAELAMEHDFQLAIQGIGDRAARELFDIYEREFARHPDRSDLRWRIEHAQVIHPDDLPRFAELGVIPGIQGIFACSDGPWVVDRLGAARTRERGYLFKSMLESGAVVMNGTDPPVEEIDPIASFHCSVTRVLPDGTVFSPEQALTREEALRSYTINNAYAAFEEDIKGSLTPGKLADITVLSKDLLTVPDNEIRSTEILYTIIGGDVRYARDGEGSE